MDAVKMIFEYTGYSAKIKLDLGMPTGPVNRVADNKLAKELLNWEPQVKFSEGLEKTIEWYFANKDRQKVLENLEKVLVERNLDIEVNSMYKKNIRRRANNKNSFKHYSRI